ncbi:MAG: hypothetical protein IKK46_00580 [Clostridia bacterium]|nr:hypothetical protein [Clostridia bacterium]
MKKKILSLIIAVCIFVLPLTVISFAGDEDNSVLNSAFYIDTKEKSDIICYVEEEEVTFEIGKNTDDFDGDFDEIPYQYVYVSVFENTQGIDDIEKLKIEKNAIFDYFVGEYLYLYEDTEFESEVSEINGYKCLKYSAVEDDMFFYTIYILATKENIYCFCTETDNENAGFIKNALASFTINGTLLDGDSHKNEVDFTNAPDYKAQAEEYGFGMTDFAAFDEETNSAARIGMLIMMLPFIILLVVTIIMIVKYSKNKKILEQYEKTYGVMGMGMQPYMMNNQMNYGAPMNNSYFPNQPMQQPTQPMNQNYQAPTDSDGQNNNF